MADVDVRALVDHHNSIVRRGAARANELEDKMTALLIPVFDKAADEAANKFLRLAAMRTVTATATPGVTSQSTMLALMPTPEQAEALAQDGGEDPENIHCTLCFLGETDAPLSEIQEAVQHVAATHAPLEGIVGGTAQFGDNGNGAPSIVLPDVPGLAELRVDVTKALAAKGIDFARNHGFTPHLTIGYGGGPPPRALVGQPLNFDHLHVVRGNSERVAVPLTGAKPLTAGYGYWLFQDSIKTQIHAVAEKHQPESGSYGATAWNEETKTVLWEAADWTTEEELAAAERDFLAIDGVDHFEYEYEGMPDGWCAAEPVYGGDPYERVCNEAAALARSEHAAEAAYAALQDMPAAFARTIEDEMLNGPLIAATPGAPPAWTQPSTTDLVDVDALTEELRAVIDPVSEKVTMLVMKTAIETAPIPPPAPTPEPAPNVVSIVAASRKAPPVGIAFDVTNPIVQAQAASSGTQIANIAEGTRQKVGSIIARNYSDGSSVDATAADLRDSMKRFSPARARLIARTELAGAVNGGSLASTQVLDEASGGLGISKVWLTAPGAPNPRHETYDGLDGQTQSLYDPFQVGDDELQYPGDPSGDPGEVCNCRCSISYTKGGQIIAQDSADEATDPETIVSEASDGGTEGDGEAVAAQAVSDAAVVAPEEAAAAEPIVAQDAAYADAITDGPAAKKLDKLYKKWGQSLTDDQDDALFTYARNNYEGINRYLRTGKASGGLPRVLLNQWVSDIDSSIDAAPAVDTALDVKVYRGITNVQKLLGTDPQIGDTFTEASFMSTTTDESIALDFSYGPNYGPAKGKALFEIIVPQGTRGAWLPAIKNSAQSAIREQELLLARGQKFRVTGIETRTIPDVGRVRVVTARLEPPIEAQDLAVPGELPEARNVAEDVRVVKAKSAAAPHAHLQSSSLNAYIALYRKQMRELLALPRLNAEQQADFKLLQTHLEDALKERATRSGIPERPYAHLSDAQLHRQVERADQAAKEIKPTNKANREKQAELKSKATALKKEQQERLKPKRGRPTQQAGQKPVSRERPVKLPPIPKSTAARRGVIKSIGRNVAITVEKRTGSGYELKGSYVDKKTGKKVSWTSRRFATKAEAEDARGRHSLGYSPVEQKEFVLANLPDTIDELGLKGRDYGYFDPARNEQADVLAILKRAQAEGTVEADGDLWRLTPTKTPMEGSVRAPYKPPVEPKNARMKRLQDAYAARYGEYRDSTQYGTVIAPGAPAATLDAVRAVGNDFRNEVESRLRSREPVRFKGTPAERQAQRMRYEAQSEREAILQVLSEIRPLGGPDALSGISPFSNADATAIMRNAASFYPADWNALLGDTRLDVSRTPGRSGVVYVAEQRRFVVDLNGASRGTALYQHYLGERVSIHELGHVYEQMVDGISDLERQFYAERTTGEGLKQAEDDHSLFYREDEFVNEYMGRDYYNVGIGSQRMPAGSIFELLSMGMESLMTGSNPLLLGDPEMANLILGMLASL